MAADDSRSFMDKLPPAVRPVAAALGFADRPLDSRERAREWIVGFLVAADEDRVNCVALLLGAADDAILCATTHKRAELDDPTCPGQDRCTGDNCPVESHQ